MNIKEKSVSPIEDTVECVEAIAKIVKEYDLGRVKFESDDMTLIVEGKRCPPPPPAPVQQVPHSACGKTEKNEGSCESYESEEYGSIIKAPIIGTFYASPSPEKPPYVNIGHTVNAGDVVCIIESMKLMNEINSEFSGKVAEIYVKDGDAVEYGQSLMRIE